MWVLGLSRKMCLIFNWIGLCIAEPPSVVPPLASVCTTSCNLVKGDTKSQNLTFFFKGRQMETHSFGVSRLPDTVFRDSDLRMGTFWNESGPSVDMGSFFSSLIVELLCLIGSDKVTAWHHDLEFWLWSEIFVFLMLFSLILAKLLNLFKHYFPHV